MTGAVSLSILLQTVSDVAHLWQKEQVDILEKYDRYLTGNSSEFSMTVKG
jgi:hypothetical protein